ncbi:hypothetical protein E2C01_031246 [Portunus trituberculatus]|uniref:Uncharacterized protein n=1 Tax=Portunus trituberculatus TaxID=210409 RepID=A0A5B7EX40_PORTR|nr:hypothetical protein [Portunus trituberculatus]
MQVKFTIHFTSCFPASRDEWCGGRGVGGGLGCGRWDAAGGGQREARGEREWSIAKADTGRRDAGGRRVICKVGCCSNKRGRKGYKSSSGGVAITTGRGSEPKLTLVMN